MDIQDAHFRNLLKRNLILVSTVVGSFVLVPILALLAIVFFGSSLKGAPSDEQFFFWHTLALLVINLAVFNIYSYRSFSITNMALNIFEYLISLVVVSILATALLGSEAVGQLLSLFF